MSPRQTTGVPTKSNTFGKNKGRAQKVIFDEDARREYLTGFHKRNVQKQEVRKKKAIERQRQERLELRKQHRRDLAERAAENAKAVETALGMIQSDAEAIESDLNEDDLPQDQELEFENDEKLAIVTVVDDFSIDSLRHGDEQNFSHSEPNFNPRTTPPNPINQTSVTKGTAKPRSHKVKYQTKTARKVERAKQRARKLEKAQKFGDKKKRRMRR